MLFCLKILKKLNTPEVVIPLNTNTKVIKTHICTIIIIKAYRYYVKVKYCYIRFYEKIIFALKKQDLRSD